MIKEAKQNLRSYPHIEVYATRNFFYLTYIFIFLVENVNFFMIKKCQTGNFPFSLPFSSFF